MLIDKLPKDIGPNIQRTPPRDIGKKLKLKKRRLPIQFANSRLSLRDNRLS
ncbi:MAG: hypothetical protein U0939_22890 [Pirellulales bacterium]